MNQELKIQEIKKNIEILHPPNKNHVIEVRIPGVDYKGKVSGYYDSDHIEKLAKDVVEYDGKAKSVYITLNPVDPALLGRANNKLKEKAENTTSDNDVIERTLLLIDIDPDRPSGISSSDEEKKRADEIMRKIFKGLKKRGFPEPIVVDSGNGRHLIFNIALENNPENTKLIERSLIAIDLMFSTEDVKIDLKVFNASRITKLPGIKACKGENTEDRPHRYSKILYVPDKRTIVSKEKLEEIAKLAPTPPQNEYQGNNYNNSQTIDIERKIQEYGLSVWRSNPYQGGTLYKLTECPFDENHKNGDASLIQFASGAIAFSCFHDSCSGKNWHSLRDKFEPGWRDKKPPKKTVPENTPQIKKQEKKDENSGIIYTPEIRGRLEEIKQLHGIRSKNHCFNDIITSAERFLYLTPDTKYVLKITTACVLANYSVDDPVWLQIIAPPSSAKTEIIVGHSGIPEAWNKSSLTSKTLISGERSNEKASLLLQIGRFGIFLIKDFTTMLELQYNERAEIFAQLREIYDGYYSKSFGTGKTISWFGKIGIIAGCTPIIEKYTPNLTALGERFLFARIDDYTKEYEDKALDKALTGDSEEISKYRDSLKKTISEFVKGRLGKAIDFKLVLNNDHINTLKKYARFIAKVRSNVIRDSYNRDSILAKPFSESPMRVGKQLKSVLKGLCITDNCNSPKDEHFAYLVKLALDNIPPLKREFIEHVPREGINRVDLARELGYKEDSGFIKRSIEDLARLGILRTDKENEKVKIDRSDIVNKFYDEINDFSMQPTDIIDNSATVPENGGDIHKKDEKQVFDDVPELLK